MDAQREVIAVADHRTLGIWVPKFHTGASGASDALVAIPFATILDVFHNADFASAEPDGATHDTDRCLVNSSVPYALIVGLHDKNVRVYYGTQTELMEDYRRLLRGFGLSQLDDSLEGRCRRRLRELLSQYGVTRGTVEVSMHRDVLRETRECFAKWACAVSFKDITISYSGDHQGWWGDSHTVRRLTVCRGGESVYENAKGYLHVDDMFKVLEADLPDFAELVVELVQCISDAALDRTDSDGD